MKNDPIDDFIVAKGLPKTRETYLSLAFADGERVEDAEFETSLPAYAKKSEASTEGPPLAEAKVRGRLSSE
jgi:hypothetical protein